MTTKIHNCPYCGRILSVQPQNLEHLKNHDWLNCPKCGLFLKVTLDEKKSTILSVESYTDPINLGTFHSAKLNKDFPAAEPSMPPNICGNLAFITGYVTHNLIADPKNPASRVFKDQTTQNWILSYIVPKIQPIYNEYPKQVAYVMSFLGLESLLVPYVAQCPACGICIPKLTQNNCPICGNRTTQQPKEGKP